MQSKTRRRSSPPPGSRPDAPAPSPLSPELAQLIDSAYRGRAPLLAEITRLCQSRYPHYATLSGSELEGLQQNIDTLVSGFYLLQLREGRVPEHHELEDPRRMARLRVAQGIPLAEMIGCYQLGLPLLWADLVDRVEPGSAVQLELLQRVPVSISAMTLVTTIVTEAYVEERERRLRWQGEAVDDLLRGLARDDTPLPGLDARARSLGLRLDKPQTAVLFRPAALGDDGGAESAFDVVRRLLGEQGRAMDFVAGRVPEGILALLPGDPEAMGLRPIGAELRSRGWRVGVGHTAHDAAGVRRSIRQSRRAVEIGTLLDLPDPLDRYADLAVLDLVDVGSPRALDFARGVLGSLAEPEAGASYRQTLRALCRQGFRLKLAAADLEIHPHTLSYRIAQIRQRHGLDLDDPETRLRVHLALVILGD